MKIPTEKIAKVIKILLDLATDKKWEVNAITEKWDCYFECKCPDGIIENFIGKSRYIEDRNWQHAIDSGEYDPIDQWASQFAYEILRFYTSKCFDNAREQAGVDWKL